MKKKLSSIALFLLGGMVSLTTSCKENSLQQEAPAHDVSYQREQNLLEVLQFKDLTPNDLLLRSNNGATLDIVNIRLGRKSRQCDGFGICEVDWFPGWNSTNNDSQLRSIVLPQGVLGLIQEDKNGDLFIELELEREVSGFTQDEMLLRVDENIEMPNSGEDAFDPGLMIKLGNYAFDNRIGDYGGYRIPVTRL